METPPSTCAPAASSSLTPTETLSLTFQQQVLSSVDVALRYHLCTCPKPLSSLEKTPSCRCCQLYPTVTTPSSPLNLLRTAVSVLVRRFMISGIAQWREKMVTCPSSSPGSTTLPVSVPPKKLKTPPPATSNES